MSAKPSSVPSTSYPPPMTLTPLVNKSNGPSYSDAFAMFLNRGPKSVEPASVVRQPNVSGTPTKGIVEPMKVIVQPVQQTPPPIQHAIQVHKTPPANVTVIQMHKSPPAKVNVVHVHKPPPAKVTVVQKKQETWTANILKQTHTQTQKKLTQNQNVTTERIQPYVSGQSQMISHLCSAPVRAGEGQIMYKIVNTPSIQNPQAQLQRVKMASQQQFH